MKETYLLCAGSVPGVRMMKWMGFSSALEELVVQWLTDVQTLSMYWGWAKTVKPDVQGEKLSCQESRGNFLRGIRLRGIWKGSRPWSVGEAAGGVGASVVCEGQQGTLGGEAGPGPVTRGICAPWLLRLPLRIIVIPHHWWERLSL